ncbi:DUF6538 domain-containing protein [Bradyrhizobium sp. NC92]|uniref:DUF6538 domain-containing protein n=1 Tax=Bradyrhizobium sp. (strain NC92) TaxID=55395 RepID=UPI0021AAB95A|nr:DUF6538 domain-containing protein [Bradyrhizobium sp. NC92]UWU68223.1 hypothetical protein N2602_34875 [Bradyrhizobium sp. NC92]
MPYLVTNTAGVWCVQRKVPDRLQSAVARVLDSKKPTQKYLKKSLGTKDRREANRRATHALADLDRTIRAAEALTQQQSPESKVSPRSTLNDAEIKRMAEWVHATTLKEDEALRFSGRLETTGPHGENVNADVVRGVLERDQRPTVRRHDWIVEVG